MKEGGGFCFVIENGMYRETSSITPYHLPLHSNHTPLTLHYCHHTTTYTTLTTLFRSSWIFLTQLIRRNIYSQDILALASFQKYLNAMYSPLLSLMKYYKTADKIYFSLYTGQNGPRTFHSHLNCTFTPFFLISLSFKKVGAKKLLIFICLRS